MVISRAPWANSASEKGLSRFLFQCTECHKGVSRVGSAAFSLCPMALDRVVFGR